MKPVFSIVANGRQDATDRIRQRLLSLTVTDEAGRQSDTAEIRLDDRDGVIELQPTGAELEISLGFDGGKETVTGRYTVDEIELEGPPDSMTIRARGADMRSNLKAQRTRSWDDVSIGDLVASIAADHGLEPRVGRPFRAVRISHLDQTDESDMHLLTRLARDYDAVAKPARGRLLFVSRGEAESATGKSMPTIRIRPEDAGKWRVTLADRREYRSVRAHWRESRDAMRMRETAGSGEPSFTLRRLYPTAGEARAAARAKLAALKRGTARLSVTLVPGNPLAAAESQLELTGFRTGVDGLWACRTVRHVLDGGGYSTRAEATLKAA